jgi:hypothetical protein
MPTISKGVGASAAKASSRGTGGSVRTHADAGRAHSGAASARSALEASSAPAAEIASMIQNPRRNP